MAIVVKTRYRVPEFDALGFETRYRCHAVAKVTTTTPSDSLWPDGIGSVPEGFPDEVKELSRGVVAAVDRMLSAGTSSVTIVKDVLIVEVVSGGGVPWRREYPMMDWEHYYTGLHGTPAPDQLLVAAGGDGWLVSADGPDAAVELVVAPVLGVRRVPGSPILLCWDFTDLVAYGPEGVLWHRDRLSIDDLRIVDVGPDLIRGTTLEPGSGPDPYILDQHIPFALDPRTGEFVHSWRTPE